jgi:plasmid stability protein
VAQLIVRNIDKEIVDLLRAQAARHGRSSEAEHREILREALQKRPARDFKQHLLAMPDVGEDIDLQIPRRRGRRVKL